MSYFTCSWLGLWHQNWVLLKCTTSPSPCPWSVQGSVISQVKECHFNMAPFVCVGFPKTTHIMYFRTVYTREAFFTFLMSLDPHNLISWCRKAETTIPMLQMRKLRLREAKAQNHFFLFSSDALTFGRKTVQSCDKYTVAPEQGTEDQAHHLPATASLENVWSQASAYHSCEFHHQPQSWKCVASLRGQIICEKKRKADLYRAPEMQALSSTFLRCDLREFPTLDFSHFGGGLRETN